MAANVDKRRELDNRITGDRGELISSAELIEYDLEFRPWMFGLAC
jgi:hypothetical protein